MKNYVAYYRVSTKRQDLGIEAQQASVRNFVEREQASIIGEYSEQESGKNDNRVELAKAIAKCKETKATLIIAKLDRLSRNGSFLYKLKDEGLDFCVVDLPDLRPITLGVFIGMAQQEREFISSRTKAALAVKKAQGVKLGAPNATFTDDMRAKAVQKRQAKSKEASKQYIELISMYREKGNTLKQIADILNDKGFKTPRGNAFTTRQIQMYLDRVKHQA